MSGSLGVVQYGQIGNLTLQLTVISLTCPRMESDFKLTRLKATHFMGTSTKTALVITFVIAVLLLLSFSDAMASGSMMSGGMLGSGSMGGISWMWIPVMVVVALGSIVLVLFTFGEK